jgi:hypothetical protein
MLKTASLIALSLLAAAPAFAGDRYGDDHPYACEQTRRNSNLAGALIGGAIGAALGHEVAARNARDEGLLLGGVLGAAVGANVGSNRVYCGEQPRVTYVPAPVYEDRGYDRGRHEGRRRHRDWDDVAYDDRYDRGYYDRYDRYGPECRMSESEIRLPNGRIERRVVEVCRDSRGDWRVKD